MNNRQIKPDKNALSNNITEFFKQWDNSLESISKLMKRIIENMDDRTHESTIGLSDEEKHLIDKFCNTKTLENFFRQLHITHKNITIEGNILRLHQHEVNKALHHE